MLARSTYGESYSSAPAASSCNVRLDPAGLPHRFRMQTEHSGGEGTVGVILSRDSVHLDRTLPSGLPLALQVPVEAFEAVSVRFLAGDSEDTFQIVLELMHADPALSVPLAIASDLHDLVADWRAWGRIFNLPLVLVESDGMAHIIENRLGAILLKTGQPRRRSVLNRRRPRFLARRKVGVVSGAPVIYEGEREIIART